MQPGTRKVVEFLTFAIVIGFIYPVIMSGIFKLDFKTSIIVGGIFGVVGGLLWIVTSNIRERRKAAKNK
jgi:hypothetical protein